MWKTDNNLAVLTDAIIRCAEEVLNPDGKGDVIELAAAILDKLPPDWCEHSLTAIEELMDEIEKREVEIATLRAIEEAARDLIEHGCWGHARHGAERCRAGALRAALGGTMKTEAGKRTAESLRKLLPNMPLTWEGIDNRIDAIEAEAVAAERERIRAAVEGLPVASMVSHAGPYQVERAAILAIIEGDTP